MADADELLRAGDLDGARAALVEVVKRAPNDQQGRMFLFQLMCVAGEWDKAAIQLRALAQISAEAQMLAMAYGQAIEAEKLRAQVFAGTAQPVLLVSSSAWAGDLVGALAALTQGQLDDAEALRDQAFDAAPDTPGELDGVAFDWIADGDARFGPAIEAIIAGQWGLVPFDAIEKITSEGPKDLRDIVWYPVQLRLQDRPVGGRPAARPVSRIGDQHEQRHTPGPRHGLGRPAFGPGRRWSARMVTQRRLGHRNPVAAKSRLPLAMAGSRLNPTLFDKLVADLDIDGLRENDNRRTGDIGGSVMRFYTVPRIERFNEAAMRATVRRELSWILNTTNLDSVQDLDPYPEVKTSVLNYGVPDLAGKTLTKRVIQSRAREIRDAIRAFEPRMDPRRIDVEALTESEQENAVTYIIRGDVTAAVQAMPVEFKTDIEIDTATVTVRE